MPLRPPYPRFGVVATLGMLVGLNAAPPAAAQATEPAPVAISKVIAAFLVDSGVRTRGLAWTTGSELPVRWATPGPVATTDSWSLKQGITRVREGEFIGTTGDSVALAWTIRLQGTEAGLQGVVLGLPAMWVDTGGGNGFYLHRGMVEDALRNDGVTLQPIKCRRETEGASYGNLVDAVRVPGKTASGLWWYWDCPRQECFLNLTLLYRRVDMNQVECFGS